jgi:hypothetical protein
MAVTAHVFPSFVLASETKTANVGVSADTIQVALIASTGGTGNTLAWNSTLQGATHFSGAAGTGLLGGSGAGTVVEVSGGSYARLSLTGASQAVADSTTFTTLTYSGTIQWTAVTFTALYAVFIDNTIGGTDSTNQLICYWDLGGAQSVSGANFTLTLGTANSVSNAIVQWTSS